MPSAPVFITQDILDNLGIQGDVYRAEFSATIAVAATGTYFIGVVVGNVPLQILSRAYTSSESPLTIELIEATFTVGTNARTLSRNLSNLNAPPAQFVSGVTPGTLGPVITGITLRAPAAGGASQVALNADDNVLITKRNTSYVVRFTNGGGANALVSGAIDYRNVS